MNLIFDKKHILNYYPKITSYKACSILSKLDSHYNRQQCTFVSFTSTPGNIKLKSKLETIMSEQIFTERQHIMDLLKTIEDNNKLAIGDFPSEWFEGMSLGKNLQASIDIREALKSAKALLLKDDMDINAKNIIEAAFKRNHIINTEQSLEFTSLLELYNSKRNPSLPRHNPNTFGLVFSMKVNGEKYAFKIFNDEQTNLTAKSSDLLKNEHGCLVETNRAFFLNNKISDGPFAKVYYSDLKNEFLISQFIEENKKMPGYSFPFYWYGLTNQDDFHDKNYVSNILVDFGGINSFAPEITNHPKIFNFFDKFARLPLEEQLNIISSDKVPKEIDFDVTLAKIISEMPDEVREPYLDILLDRLIEKNKSDVLLSILHFCFVSKSKSIFHKAIELSIQSNNIEALSSINFILDYYPNLTDQERLEQKNKIGKILANP